jgi:hypothetical protein
MPSLHWHLPFLCVLFLSTLSSWAQQPLPFGSGFAPTFSSSSTTWKALSTAMTKRFRRYHELLADLQCEGVDEWDQFGDIPE